MFVLFFAYNIQNYTKGNAMAKEKHAFSLNKAQRLFKPVTQSKCWLKYSIPLCVASFSMLILSCSLG